MLKVNLILISFLFLSSIVPNKFTFLLPQTSSDTKYSITMIASRDGFTELEKTFYNNFKTKLIENNLYSDTDNEMEILIDIKKIEKPDKVALSFLYLKNFQMKFWNLK